MRKTRGKCWKYCEKCPGNEREIATDHVRPSRGGETEGRRPGPRTLVELHPRVHEIRGVLPKENQKPLFLFQIQPLHMLN